MVIGKGAALTMGSIWLARLTHNLCVLSMRVPNPRAILDKFLAYIGRENLSSTGAGIWKKSLGAFPDSRSVLDLQSPWPATEVPNPRH